MAGGGCSCENAEHIQAQMAAAERRQSSIKQREMLQAAGAWTSSKHARRLGTLGTADCTNPLMSPSPPGKIGTGWLSIS